MASPLFSQGPNEGEIECYGQRAPPLRQFWPVSSGRRPRKSRAPGPGSRSRPTRHWRSRRSCGPTGQASSAVNSPCSKSTREWFGDEHDADSGRQSREPNKPQPERQVRRCGDDRRALRGGSAADKSPWQWRYPGCRPAIDKTIRVVIAAASPIAWDTRQQQASRSSASPHR